MDGVFTALEIQLGLATEANPFMVAVIDVAGLFGLILCKFGVSLVGAGILRKFRDYAIARHGALVLSIVFGILCIYHCWILS